MNWQGILAFGIAIVIAFFIFKWAFAFLKSAGI